MKKTLMILMMVALSLFIVACATPPSDVPVADVDGDVQEVKEVTPAVDDIEAEEFNDKLELSSRDGVYAIDTTQSTFEFEGYAIGKSHVGTFDEWSGTLVYEEGVLVGITGTISLISVDAGIEKLNAHLQSEDFFDVETYPELTVDFSDISANSISGDLTFKGVTKKITFPAEISADSVKTDFLLDVAPFGMDYTGVNSEVRIGFEFVAQE